MKHIDFVFMGKAETGEFLPIVHLIYNMNTKTCDGNVMMVWGYRCKYVANKSKTHKDGDKKELPSKKKNEGQKKDNNTYGCVIFTVTLFKRSGWCVPFQKHPLFIAVVLGILLLFVNWLLVLVHTF